MPHPSRARRWVAATVVASAVLLVLAACANGPNTTFDPHTEFGRAEDDLWKLLLRLGTAVFIFVEALLLYAIIKFRHREGAPEPAHVHGNTRLEILWTAIPAVVLAFIAVPTVKTIFETQAKASPDALQVEVYGHQWWWEFRYPQYGVVTANELYLPIGHKVNFSLRTVDVLHSFWIPQMGGKRDLISNHTNYLWFTPDSTLPDSAWNGSCNEYCGTSHANMKFRVYTVLPAQFASWAQHQALASTYGVTPPAPAPADAPAPAAPAKTSAVDANPLIHPVAQTTGATTPSGPAPDSGYVYPIEKLPDNVIPHTPTPAGLTVDGPVVGDAQKGHDLYSRSACIGCHTIKGNPSSVGIIGPNLTHIASRHTIAAGLYPNDAEHLHLWIKNARAMKPGVLMPTLGLNQIDPITHSTVTAGVGGLTDAQIADIVAYLQQLK
jgi:cytochrome c oxidase subunit 2